MGLDPHWEIIREAHRGFGGNINNFVLALEHVVDTDAWRCYEPPGEPRQEPETFSGFIRQVFSVEPDVIEGMLRKANAKAAAERVLAFIRADLPKAGDNGGKRVKGQQVDNIKLLRGGTDPTYVVARLKRDERQDLADRVIAGELSPNAAAIEAGFRHPMINVRADDPVAAVRALLRRYTAQEIQAAIEQMR